MNRSEGDKVKKGEVGPRELLKVFDLTEVGIAVEPAQGGVKIGKLLQESVFDGEGFREGDVLIAMDTARVGTATALIERLRKRVAGDITVVEVQRGESRTTISIRH